MTALPAACAVIAIMEMIMTRRNSLKTTGLGHAIIVEFTDGSAIALPIARDGRTDVMITVPKCQPDAEPKSTEAGRWGRNLLKRATNIASVRTHLD